MASQHGHTTSLSGESAGRQTWVKGAGKDDVPPFDASKNPNASDLLFRAQRIKAWREAGNPVPDERQVPKTAEEAASSFVNPLTAVGMVKTMTAEGHSGIVHTAAASQLGQMLVKLCKADGIPLVNVVRRPEQVELLESIGAEFVVDSSADSYESDLVKAMAGSGATICFDALGGGTLGFEIIRAMETAANMSGSERTGYGSTTFKKLYICECSRSLRVFFRRLKEAAAQTAD